MTSVMADNVQYAIGLQRNKTTLVFHEDVMPNCAG